MSKIKHWNESTLSWDIDGASNAANIELTNPGYLNEDGSSISVDLGFTKIDNRMHKMERNLAWIYQNGAKGGSGGGSGSGGTVDSIEYTIEVEEGNRVYTASSSVTIHLTIKGGSVRKIFLVEISNASTGERLATPVVTGLTRTEITINNLGNSTQTLKITAHSGLLYASDYILTVVAGAITLSASTTPPSQIYPGSLLTSPAFSVSNSTDSDLKIVVTYSTDQINYITLVERDLLKSQSLSLDFTLPEISSLLYNMSLSNIGETFYFVIYALGVLNDNVLRSKSITFSTTITAPGKLYIITYNVNKTVPTNIGDLILLNSYVYGLNISFFYELSYSKNTYPTYIVNYTITPCYFEDGVLVAREDLSISASTPLINKGERTSFSNGTASLPNDTLYDSEANLFKFVRITLVASAVDNPEITDTKTLYVTLTRPIDKYITATNFDNSLVCYYSPVMGVPAGNVNTWQYDNRNYNFPYNPYGIVQLRYINLVGYNVNGLRNGYSSQGIHLVGKSYALLEYNLFSSLSYETNLLNANGFTISSTFRTDANVEDGDTVLSIGNYKDGEGLIAGIEILSNKVRVVVNRLETSLNITKGDLVTVDIVFERYVGEDDDENFPTHWFVKIFLNGVLSSLGSYTNTQFTYAALEAGWYFDNYICLGARVNNGNVISSADVHFYDFKVYSTALSDNEIVLNYISSTIYSELRDSDNPSLSLLVELLSKNFILMNTNGEYESLLFDTVNKREYKNDNELFNTLRTALADSKISYPIVVINLINPNSDFYGTTQSLFSEDLKEIVTGEQYRYPINIDYYTMGSIQPVRISNADRMLASILGTSSLQFSSKNYEIYLGNSENNKPLLVLMREDWLPENEFTLKADVMDSAHANNVLIGKIINGMVTTKDASGNDVAIKPLQNTPPMSINNEWSNKIKHTSEGYPVILFINFKMSDGTTICKCQGIYNFNLGRAASFNLGLKLINSCTFVDNSATFPRVVESYEESTVVSQGAPVYSIEVGENNQLVGAFDLDDSNIVTSGIFDTIYHSDGSASLHLLRLLTFLAEFGCPGETPTPKKVQIDGKWCTPKMVLNGNDWVESGTYYYPETEANYVQSTLEMHMNWNNLIVYYMIAIIFGMVDSMGKNLTLRTWNTTADLNGQLLCVWYTCFYDMDTAMRLDNGGNETVPYNAHINRYYTDSSESTSKIKISYHIPSIPGEFTLSYSAYNTRLLEIAENLGGVSKTLQDVYLELRSNLFPNPGEFIDTYYTGQINLVGAALYNYDYKLKYLLTKKQYSVKDLSLVGTHDYNLISFLHGNGSTNIKSWFKKRIRFLDGIYGVSTSGMNLLNGTLLTDVVLMDKWTDNNTTWYNGDPSILQLTLSAESLTLVTFAAGDATNAMIWINEVPTVYKIKNVSSTLRLSISGNKSITVLDGFEKFRWTFLTNIEFPLIKSLSLKDATSITSEGFLSAQKTTDLESLRTLDMSGVLLTSNSNIIYKGLDFVKNLPSLEWLDISGSSFNDISLPESGVLKYLNVSNTKIKKIEFSGQPLLEIIDINGCNELEIIKLTNCPKLKTINVPLSVRTVEIANCPGLQSLYADYTGSLLLISNLELINISACPGLKIVSINSLNNLLLKINLEGAPNIENLSLSKLLTTDVTFPSKNVWKSLKVLNLNESSIGAFNYLGSTTEDFLDLRGFSNLERIDVASNRNITGIKCPNILGHYIQLLSSALADCSTLRYLYGNFMLSGTRIFSGCSSLTLNNSRIYNRYGLVYPIPFMDDDEACNIIISPTLNSMDEMFQGCTSLSGGDFTMLMLSLTNNITSLNKMFLNCSGVNAEIKYDLFRHCPNVSNITSFAEGTSLCGGIYSRSDEFSLDDTFTYGTFDFLPLLLLISNAFNGSMLQYIDNNIFAPLNGKYIKLKEADYVFSNCAALESCVKVTRTEIITGGYLLSKTFFTNLRNIGTFPVGMFTGCYNIRMVINSEEVDGVIFDYLFHWPYTINLKVIDSSIYLGIKLIGEIHDNVFGGVLNSDGEYSIVEYRTINAPFELSGGNIRCNLSNMSNMFQGVRDTLLLAKYVFRGVDFTDSYIPNDIFTGCSKLTNIQGFFSNTTLTNNGQVFEFPNPLLFKDCTSLQDASYLFDNSYNLDIKLIGEGFVNCALKNVDGMFYCSGVFGMIPYRLFYMEKDGTILQTIDSISNVFGYCYKLGYTRDRLIDIGTPYWVVNSEYRTVWTDGVVKVEGTRVPFLLDFTNFDGSDPWYIDGRDWKTINPELANSPYYNDLYNTVFKYDEKQAITLTSNILGWGNDAEPGYQNYMFPADYFRYCSANCTMEHAFRGLTYRNLYINYDSNGIERLEVNDNYQGLTGRLPCKLFSANQDNTKFLSIFENLLFCAFVNFDSYSMNLNNDVNHPSLYRGIKYPPDLLKSNINLNSVSELFKGTYIEVGVDINPDLLSTNLLLTDISRLFLDVTFNELDYKNSLSLDPNKNNNPLISYDMFKPCTLLQNVSGLFSVSNNTDHTRGLRIVQNTLFDPLGVDDASNSRITNISSMFANNRLLRGTIPLFEEAKFPRIVNSSGYVEGVNKEYITNASIFISTHNNSRAWIPQTWLENNE